MSTNSTHRFGVFDIGFELTSDWQELTKHWQRYSAYFKYEGKPLFRYVASSSGSTPILNRTGHEPRHLKRKIDFYPLLEEAFLSDLVGKLSSRYPIYHAAVVAKHGKATIYLGESNAGKSSLCSLRVQEGWTYLSDEMAAVDGDEVVALPRPICFNELENPSKIMPIGDKRFLSTEYDFVDKNGSVRRARQFLPKADLAAMAGDRFKIKNVVFLESVKDGPPLQHVLKGAEKRARLALSQFPGQDGQ